MINYIAGGIFILSGVLSFLGGITSAGWLMDSHQTTFFIRLIGKKATRYVYVFIGLLCIIAGLVIVADSLAAA
ncbi:MAG: immunity 17 family protein [Candidatus Azobacteroides sp.]|nr:immunity 17 family protein [Candidatus Azobacteroides sp.]